MVDHSNVRQYSDQLYCSNCGKTWDVNDPYPPACMSGHDKFLQIRDELKRINENDRVKRNINS